MGAFDRTLGFIYGLARGLVLVAIAYLFYGWLNPPENQEDWIRNAKSLPVVQSVSNGIVAVIERIAPDAAQNLSESAISNPQGPAEGAETGYSNGQTQGLENLVDGQTQQPAAGTNNNQ